MKYIIYCGPGIGDLVLILPMIQKIKEVDKEAYICILNASDKKRIAINRKLKEIQRNIDRIEYYSMKELGHSIWMLFRLGYKKYDVGFSLQYTNNKNTSMWPSKLINFAAKKTCGIQVTERSGIKYDYQIPLLKGTRISDYPIKMLSKVLNQEIGTVNYSSLVEKEIIKKELGTLKIPLDKDAISLVVGTAFVSGKIDGKRIIKDLKSWDYEKWLELSNKLAEHGKTVFLLGGLKEREESKEVFDKIGNEKIYNLIGKCNILQSMAVISTSKLVIGADTGMMHCAGVLDVPALTLFGCTDYKEYLPFGERSYYIVGKCQKSPCFGTEEALLCEEKKCMSSIMVEDVIKRAMQILKEER